MTKTMRFGRYTVEVKREDKVLFPDAGVTKGDLADYYAEVAERMLPHLKGRPLSLRRFPDGIGKGGFFQKDTPDYFPDWIGTARLGKEGGDVDYVVAANAATLAYLADQAAIEIHEALATADDPHAAVEIVIDFDPPGDDFAAVRRGALELRDLLDDLGLPSWVKTTGSRGLHVIVPLSGRNDLDDARAFARGVAEVMVERHPDRYTTAARKEKRGDRIYLDVGRNAYGQTAVAPYSVRARPGAPIAIPVDWSEVEDAKLRPDFVTVENVRRRLEQKDDPWADLRRHGRSLSGPRKKLERLRAE